MIRRAFHLLKPLVVALITTLLMACASAIKVAPESALVTTPQEVLSLSPGAEPLIKARLRDVTIKPFNQVRSQSDLKYQREVSGYDYEIESDFKKNLQALLRTKGLFGASDKDAIDVIAKLVSWERDPGGVRPLTKMEVTISYEFRMQDGTLFFSKDVTSQGTDDTFRGPVRSRKCAKTTFLNNVLRLGAVVKGKLPGTWQAIVQEREAARRRISVGLKKENRYFRVIPSKAVVRNLPDSEAHEVMSLPQAELVNITGSLPSGWLQVASPIFPVRSSK